MKHRLGLRLRMNSSTVLVITALITLISLQLVACFTVPSTYSTISGRRTWAKEGSQQSFSLRKKHPLLSYSQKDSTRNTHGEKNNLKRRKAPNSRIAIRWVVESIEKVLENENSNPEKKDGNNSKEDDNVLLSALDRMLKAKSKQEALVAEGILLDLEIENKYSFAVQERVMKAASMSGYVKLALKILDSMVDMRNGQNMNDEETSNPIYIPSYMAYTSIFNRLRKWRKINTMRETLVKLSRACKLKGEILHLVALNTYLAALCDCVKEHRRQHEDDYLVKIGEAVSLLHPNVAMERYNLPQPDVMSFNTVLNAAAEIQHETMINDIVALMKKQGVNPDIVTYNAMLKAAPTVAGKVEVFDEILQEPRLAADRFTVELALVPLAIDGRVSDLLNLIKKYCSSDTLNYGIPNAFSTFLLALVKGGEIDIARAVFDIFILPPTLEKSDSTIELISNNNDDGGSDYESVEVKAITRHFNALFEGYRVLDDPFKWSKETYSKISPQENCRVLLGHMKVMGVVPDSYTITLLVSLQTNSNDITKVWNGIMQMSKIDMEAPVYHSIISAYGKAGDAASACYVFDKMIGSSSFSNKGNSWNVILSALSKASTKNPNVVIHCDFSNASQLKLETEISNEKRFSGQDFTIFVDGLTPPRASKRILSLMNEAKDSVELSDLVFRPNSQSYCLVASALSQSGEVGANDAIELYESASSNGLSVDGRFLNPIIRCYGEDILEALEAWKLVYRPDILALVGEGEYDKSFPSFKTSRMGKNLSAAYHGLMHVAGKAYRPDIALRIAYAMGKEGVEPTEAALNTYNAGARLRRPNKDKVRLHSQYENLLLVECTKYDSNDKRRLLDRKVRIII